MISLIVAMDKNNLIGYNNYMPWNIPEDLKLFKEITTNNIVIMGRKTFESIGKALPDRINIVLTNNTNFTSNNIEVFNSPDKALEKAKHLQTQLNKKIFVIGGKSIYEYFFPQVEELHISHIKGDYSGDTHFPEIDLSTFTLIKQIEFNNFVYCHYLKNTCNF
ncbi:dihydrofolate reductase [Cetobacterium sp. ZOR0034]|uniref:dihydrofolate reductase n=1 Tax=Cetobacterium sp. ZOR0034 TaxID=1339239 RepID=UPI00064672FF|nr:dihydrofolate reductase [Cetobacterium sp. ZOR0034]